MTAPTSCVVVCTRDRPQQLARCLAAIRAQSVQPDELIVVDNSQGDPATAAAAARYGARLLLQPRPGASRARNTGAAAAASEVVAFIDDDAVAGPGWLAGYVAAFRDPGIHAATGRVLGLTSPAHARVDLGAEPRRFDRSSASWFEEANFGGIGLGLNMAFRRSLFADGFGFCEWLGVGTPIPGGEEHYAFFTLLKRGYVIAYVPKAVAHHDDAAGPAAERRREHRILDSSLAYLFALLVHESGYRRATLRYAWEGARGTPRDWTPQGSAPLRFSRWRVVKAALLAPGRYAASRLLR